MKLFLKIFLWFLAAIALMVGVVIFVTRTFQTEPAFSRWQRSARNQLEFYRTTAIQVQRTGGDGELTVYLSNLVENGTIKDVMLVDLNEHAMFGTPGAVGEFEIVTARARTSGVPEIEVNGIDPALGAIPVTFADGRRALLGIRWEPPRVPSLFFDNWVGYLRLLGLIVSAILVCYLLAAYLTSPIRKLREATQKLAGGELASRVAPSVGRRRDELADLARDFDVMAERIEALVTSQQRLSRDVSHELRSPLARLNVALEIAKQRSNAETLPVLGRIETESARLNEMISRILTLSRLESGGEDIDKVSVDLAALVNDIAEDADFEAKAKGKSVVVDHADACTIPGNENLLRSAIENVVRNAVRYTADGTPVLISLDAVNGTARVKIVDKGSGVPEEELENLFRPFYRVAEARDRRSGGTGLGLAIAKRAIMAHKGTIDARNLSDGLEVEITLSREARNGKES